MTDKKELKKQLTKPKTKLRQIRLLNELTTTEMASYIGLERRQYEQKEKGRYPFHDYEMQILSKKMNENINDLFFE